MPALLTTIQISNFRSCIEAQLQLSQYTALVGYNNSGKSNVLSAIQWLLRKYVLDASDFSRRDNAVIITGTFEDINENCLNNLSSQHRQKIEPFVANGKISIRRSQPAPNVKSSEISLSILNPDTLEWTVNPTGIDNAINALFPEPIRIGAMENATEDASKPRSTTTIGKLLAEFSSSIRSTHETELASHLEEISKRISADGVNRLTELRNIDASINRKINDLFPGIRLKLDFPTPTLEDLIRSGTVRVYENEDTGRNFGSYGHGTQRSVQMALVRHLADVRRGDSEHSSTTMLLIDEPELYLHPFAIEHVREALRTLSTLNYQIIFSTHSAQMIPSDDAANAILIRKDPTRGTYCRRRLLDAVQRVARNSTHQIEHLFSLTHSSQILFAEHVVLAEGKTEQRLIPKLFFIKNAKTLAQCKIALVPQTGSGDTKKSLDILAAMDIPSKAIVDLDYAFKEAARHGYLAADDEDILAVKSLIPEIASRNRFAIDPNTHLPRNNEQYSAAEEYEIISTEPAITTNILNIHNKLKSVGIWVWKSGAIEKPLGLTAKTESEWARFIQQCESSSLEHACRDYDQISALIDWIAED